MSEIHIVISAKECLSRYNTYYSEVVADKRLVREKVNHFLDIAGDTLLEFGTLKFEFFTYSPYLNQAVIVFKFKITDNLGYCKYKLKHPGEYGALTELSSYYHILNSLVDNSWIRVDNETLLSDMSSHYC